jgi:hypothetical protein
METVTLYLPGLNPEIDHAPFDVDVALRTHPPTELRS